MSKVTTWRQRVNKIHLEDYIKIVCYAMQKLIVKISSGRGLLCPRCKLHRVGLCSRGGIMSMLQNSWGIMSTKTTMSRVGGWGKNHKNLEVSVKYNKGN